MSHIKLTPQLHQDVMLHDKMEAFFSWQKQQKTTSAAKCWKDTFTNSQQAGKMGYALMKTRLLFLL